MVEWPTSSMEIFIYLHVLVSLEMEECPHLPGVQGSYCLCAGLYICFACFGLISLHLSPVSLLVYVDFSHWNHLSFFRWLSWTCFDLCYGLMDLFCIAQSYYLLRTATSICPHLLSSTALSSGSIGRNVYGLICNSSLYFLNIIYMMIFSLKKSRWLEVQFPELKKNIYIIFSHSCSLSSVSNCGSNELLVTKGNCWLFIINPIKRVTLTSNCKPLL